MALTFGAATSDRVDHGSDASLDDFDPFTFWCWCRPTTFTSLRRVFEKRVANTDGKLLFLNGTSGDMRILVDRATSDTDFATNGTPLTLNAWNFVAVTFDSSAASGEAINMYVGSLTAEAVEPSYGTFLNGSGAVSSEASESLIIANRPGADRAFQGDFAVAGYVPVALSLNQIISIQFAPRQVANGAMYTHYGFGNGVGPQLDRSGNGNNGTVTGATLASHHPIMFPSAPMALGVPSAAVAADEGPLIAGKLIGGGRLMRGRLVG